MKILVLGDSTTFGAELPDLPVKCFGNYGNDYIDADGIAKFAPASNLAWPALLANKLNGTVDNRSIVGGSNDRIFRLAIEQTILEQYDLVICAWTSLDRFDLTDGSRDLAITLNSTWGFDWVKDYIASHWDRVRSDTNFITKLIALQSYFAHRKQPYLFVKSIGINLCKEVHLFQQQLDLTYCVDWDSNFYEWAKQDPKGSDGHILEQGHQTVADIIYRHVTSLQLD